MVALLRSRALASYLAAYGLAQVAAHFSFVALSILVYDRTREPLAVAAVMLCGEVVPALLAAPLVAAIDRRPARLTVSLTYAAEALAYALFAGLLLTGADGNTLVALACAVTFVEGLCSLTARPLLRTALVIGASERGLAREVNALMNVVMTTALAVAPLLAGMILVATSTVFAIWVVVGLLALGTVVVVASPSLRTSDGQVGGRGRAAGSRLRDSVRFIRRDAPQTGRLLIAQSLAMLCFMMVAPVEVVLVREEFGGAEILGALLTTWGLGAAASGLMYARWPHLRLRPLIVGSTALLAVGFAVMGVAPNSIVLCLGALLCGIGNGVQWVGFISLLQSGLPDAMQARVVALAESAASIAPAIGFLLGGAIASTSARGAMIAAAALTLLAALALARATAPIAGPRSASEHLAVDANAV